MSGPLGHPFRLRKQPSVLARQWFKPGDHPAVTHKMKAEGANADYGYVLGEDLIVVPGDWVLTLENGKHKVVGNNTFLDLYEPVKGRY